MSSDWRLAKSLIVLTSEIEYFYPDTTVWDIGDKNHQDSWSDHNPSECCDVVCAVDVLADRGLDLSKFTAHLTANPPPNLRYVIFNRKIYQRSNGFEARDYNGVNAHKTHVHVSVGNGPDGRSTRDYDSTATWDIDSLADNQGGDMAERNIAEYGDTGAWVKLVQRYLGDLGAKLTRDGIYRDETTAAAKWVFVNRFGGNPNDYDGRSITDWMLREFIRRDQDARTANAIKAALADLAPTGPTQAQVDAAVAKYLAANPVKVPTGVKVNLGTVSGTLTTSG
jgi:hypothetical protein